MSSHSASGTEVLAVPGADLRLINDDLAPVAPGALVYLAAASAFKGAVVAEPAMKG